MRAGLGCPVLTRSRLDLTRYIVDACTLVVPATNELIQWWRLYGHRDEIGVMMCDDDVELNIGVIGEKCRQFPDHDRLRDQRGHADTYSPAIAAPRSLSIGVRPLQVPRIRNVRFLVAAARIRGIAPPGGPLTDEYNLR
jgi:hypothetical protein